MCTCLCVCSCSYNPHNELSQQLLRRIHPKHYPKLQSNRSAELTQPPRKLNVVRIRMQSRMCYGTNAALAKTAVAAGVGTNGTNAHRKRPASSRSFSHDPTHDKVVAVVVVGVVAAIAVLVDSRSDSATRCTYLYSHHVCSYSTYECVYLCMCASVLHPHRIYIAKLSLHAGTLSTIA